MTTEQTPRHWFEPIAEHLGAAYLRYSFTKGTEQEVTFLVDALGLSPGSRVLDVGCGPGRHAHALARRGIEVVGIDISERFIALAAEGAPGGATFRRGDARELRFADEFDAAISLCQGGFGLLDGESADALVLVGMIRALRPGGRLALTAFNAYFRVRYDGDPGLHSFDADRGIDHERTVIKDPQGLPRDVELWTTCYTPRELRLLAARAGLVVQGIWSVAPGDYGFVTPDWEHPELLLMGSKPARSGGGAEELGLGAREPSC